MTMRICIVSAFEDTMSKDTGFSVRIYNLAKNLAALGNDVDLVLPKFTETCERIDGVTVHCLKGFTPKRILKQISKFMGVLRPTSLFYYDLLFILRASRIIRASDVVQFEQQSAGAFLIPIAAKILKKPVIVDCHNIFLSLKIKETNLLRKIFETFVEKMIYNFANVILAVSEKEKHLLLSFRGGKGRIEVIPNGVDTEVFVKPRDAAKIRERFGLAKHRVVVFVGNMQYAPNKEAVRLIALKIGPLVENAIKDVKFLIVGRLDGPVYPNLNYLGVVKDIVPILAVSDVGIAPLLNGSGTRLKILEYLSCGLPVVSTAVGAEGLDVENGVHAMIENDMNVFASKLIQVLSDTQLSRQLGQSARELVVKKYDWSKIAGLLNEVCESLLSKW